MNGASTNPDFHVLAHGGCTGKSCTGCNHCTGWRELCILGWKRRLYEFAEYNMKREKEHLAGSYIQQKIMQERMVLKEHSLLSQNPVNQPNTNMIMIVKQ